MEHSMEDLNRVEYHFADDANDEDGVSEGVVIDKDFIPTQNEGTAALLIPDKNLPVGFIQDDIAYGSLASFSDKDLILLGFNKRQTRDPLIRELKNLLNQIEHLEQYLARTNLEVYKTNIRHVAENLENLKISLLAAKLKLIVGHCKDIVIGDNVYASALVLKVLNEMNTNANCIEKQVDNLKSGNLTCVENRIRSSLALTGPDFMKKLIIGFAAVSGLFGIRFFLYNIFKQPKLN